MFEGHKTQTSSTRQIARVNFSMLPLFGALQKRSKKFVNINYFSSIFNSKWWSAVSPCYSISPESVINQLQDGGGFDA